MSATATATTVIDPQAGGNVTILEQTPYLVSLMTMLRSRDTDGLQFAACTAKVARLVISSG